MSSISSSIASWWLNANGIFPWAEHNQGVISVVALVAALILVLIEQGRANAAESKANRAAEEAKALAEETKVRVSAEAREAAVTQRLATVSEFAIAARGVLLDVERDLQDDLEVTRQYMWDSATFQVPAERVRQGAKASAHTLNALLAATPLSPALVRSTRLGVSALLAVADAPRTVTEEDFAATYATWVDDLIASREAISESEREYLHRLRPPPPQVAEASQSHSALW